MLASLNYRPHHSWIEKIHPAARWIFAFLTTLAITTFWDVRFLAFFFLLAIVQYRLARVTWAETRRAWLVVLLIMFTMIFLNTIITGAGTIGAVMQSGHPILVLPIRVPLVGWETTFTLTVERLWFALAQFLRIVSIAMLFMIIPFTMDPRVYGVTFRKLGLPDRLAFTTDLAFRFIPTLSRDFMMTLDAQRARGYEIERAQGGLIAQIRRVAPLLVPVTMNAILTGEDVANAMDLRCFGLRPRTWILATPYRGLDWAVIAFSVALLVGSLVIRYGLGLGDFWVPPWLFS